MMRAPLAIVLLAALAGCGSDVPRIGRLGSNAVILAFGDSLTHGTGAAAAQSYPAYLEALSGRRVINEGVPGELSAAGLARLPAVLERREPALMILCHAGNDMLRKNDLARAKDNLRAMVTLARARGVAVVLIGVPKPGLFLSTAEFYGEIAAEMNLPAELDALADIIADASLKADAVHPNAKGYQHLAEAVFELLEHAGAL